MTQTDAEKAVLAWCRSHRGPQFVPCMRERHASVVASGAPRYAVIDGSCIGGTPVAHGETWDEVLEQLQGVES